MTVAEIEVVVGGRGRRKIVIPWKRGGCGRRLGQGSRKAGDLQVKLGVIRIWRGTRIRRVIGMAVAGIKNGTAEIRGADPLDQEGIDINFSGRTEAAVQPKTGNEKFAVRGDPVNSGAVIGLGKLAVKGIGRHGKGSAHGVKRDGSSPAFQLKIPIPNLVGIIWVAFFPERVGARVGICRP